MALPTLEETYDDYMRLIGQTADSVESWEDRLVAAAPQAGKDSFKGASKQFVKSFADPAERKAPKLFKGVGKNIARGQLKQWGGWCGFVASWLWKTWDFKKALEKVAEVSHPNVPIVKFYELASFVSDVIEDVAKLYLAYQKKVMIEEMTEQLDFVNAAHNKTEVRLHRELDQVLKQAADAPDEVLGHYRRPPVSTWLSRLRIEDNDNNTVARLRDANAAAMTRSMDEPPLTGNARAGVCWLLKKVVLSDLNYLHSIRLQLSQVGTLAEAFVRHCQNGADDPSNEGLGFPDYQGYVHPKRQAFLNKAVEVLAPRVDETRVKCYRLGNLAFNVWSLIGYSLGMTYDEAVWAGVD